MAAKGETRTGSAMRRRTAARLAAVQAIYEMEISNRDATSVLRDFHGHTWDGTLSTADDEEEGGRGGEPVRIEPESGFLSELVRGISERRTDLDAMIAPALSADWPLERLETVLRAILRAGAFELLARTDIPVRVVISEYVDIAHAFFEGSESGLVNAVLDRLGRTLRADETGGKGSERENPPR